jgi:hypothetical protein
MEGQRRNHRASQSRCTTRPTRSPAATRLRAAPFAFRAASAAHRRPQIGRPPHTLSGGRSKGVMALVPSPALWPPGRRGSPLGRGAQPSCPPARTGRMFDCSAAGGATLGEQEGIPMIRTAPQTRIGHARCPRRPGIHRCVSRTGFPNEGYRTPPNMQLSRNVERSSPFHPGGRYIVRSNESARRA